MISIFSGNDSTNLWKAIGRVKKKRTEDALCSMGYKCQELEDVVDVLEKRIERLEAKSAKD